MSVRGWLLCALLLPLPAFSAAHTENDKLRDWKDGVVKRLTSGLSGLARQRKVTVVEGTGRFISLNQVEVLSGGTAKTISFEQAINPDYPRLHYISTSRPTSTTWAAGTPKYAAGRLALRCIVANKVFLQTAMPHALPVGITITRLK